MLPKTNNEFKHVNVAMFLYDIDRNISNVTISSHMEALLTFTKDGATATFVILVTDEAREEGKVWFDVKDIENIVSSYASDKIEVIIVPQVNKKRGAYKQFFEVILDAENGPQYRSEEIIFWFVDGDSEVPKELCHCFIKEAARPLSIENKIGGVTVHNKAKVYSDSPWVIAQVVYTKGPARGFVNQGSTNVLTGRGSMIIGTIALDKEFQKLVTEDLINHTVKSDVKLFSGSPFLFPFRLLLIVLGFFIKFPKKVFYSATGDDKSTIYYIFKKGWGVRYNPDIYVICHEDIPWSVKKLPNIWLFQFPALAVRYCRNSLNNNPRLLRLGVEKLGVTRYVMNWTDRHLFWTPLIGPISTIFLMNVWGFDYLYVYISWKIVSRSLATFIICMATREKWSAFYPIMLIYVQDILPLVKLWALVSAISHWTRQDEKIVDPEAPKEILAFIVLVSMVILFVGIKTRVIWVPGFQELVVMVTSLIT